MQIKYTRDLRRVYFGEAPKLSVVAEAFGQNVAEAWLMAELHDLNEFSGAREKMTPRLLEDTAQQIYDKWQRFTASEFMLFFKRFKQGNYERFFGSTDPIIVTKALKIFADEREADRIKIQQEDERRQRDERDAIAEEARRKRRSVNLGIREWGELVDAGYTEAEILARQRKLREINNNKP